MGCAVPSGQHEKRSWEDYVVTDRWAWDSRARALVGAPEKISWGEYVERLVSTVAAQQSELAAAGTAVTQANALAARYRRERNA